LVLGQKLFLNRWRVNSSADSGLAIFENGSGLCILAAVLRRKWQSAAFCHDRIKDALDPGYSYD
jgi:hypothetical protein